MSILKYNSYAAEIAPAHGGALLSFRCGGADILRPASSAAAVAEDPRNAACFPCVPYFGRLYNGLELDGRRWAQKPTLPICDQEHAIHGEGWVSAWNVIAETESSLTCVFDHNGAAPGRFPFPYQAKQEIHLEDNGIKIVLSLTNNGAEPMPGGLGLHPYFARAVDTRIRFSARGFWTPPTDGGTTTGPLGAAPTDLDFSQGRALPVRPLDHSFAAFGGEALVDGGGRTVRLASDAPHLHVYAPAGENFFCLEPVTNLPGALTAPADLAPPALAPGETRRLTMTLRSSTD